MKNIIKLLFLLIPFFGLGQQAFENTYAPVLHKNKDWKLAAHTYYTQDNNSNYLSNEFSYALNNGQFIDSDSKDQQMSKIEGPIRAQRLSDGGFGVWINQAKKEKPFYFYAGMDVQQVMDAEIHENFFGLALYGNKKYAGEKISFSNTQYANTYFNRLKFGLGKTINSQGLIHSFSGILAFSIGQNYSYYLINEAHLFTPVDGDYLELDINAEAQLGNTTWGDIFTINGLGLSADLYYAVLKEKQFFASIKIHNLGFVHWNKSPFSALIDTNYRFDGLSNDSSQSQEIPENFAQQDIRDLIFPNPDHSSFNKMLPLDIKLSAGKYLMQGNLYIGTKIDIYPSLIANYRAELFATWYLKPQLQLTPIISYSSFNKLYLGFAFSWQIKEMIYIKAGSSYLNTTFNPASPVGQGGFLSLTLVL
ncbi:MAG: hypothetical protein B7C24_15135 [Bacteroidetes bacterium 4572_77]|nr:MAG: hypothetical protein B7C24_15135 [Bacteroidetes bacterium 4572_77]